MEADRHSAGHFEPVAQMRRLAKIPLEPFEMKTTGFVPVILRLPSNPSCRADDELLKLHLMTDANLDLDDELMNLEAEVNGLSEYDSVEFDNEKKPPYRKGKLKLLSDEINQPNKRTGQQRVKTKQLKQKQDARDSGASGHSRLSQMSGHNMSAAPRSLSECDSDSLTSVTISQLSSASVSPSGERIGAKQIQKQRSSNTKRSPQSHGLINRKSQEKQRKASTVERESSAKTLVEDNKKSTEQERDKDALDSNNSGISRLSRMSGRNMRAAPRTDSRRESNSSSLAESDIQSIISVSVNRRSASPAPPSSTERKNAKEGRRRMNSLQTESIDQDDRNLVEQMKEERRRERERLKDRVKAQEVINKMHRDISSNTRAPGGGGNEKKPNYRQSRVGGAKSVDGYSRNTPDRSDRDGRGKVRPVPADSRETNEVRRSRPYSAKTSNASSVSELLSEMSVKDRESVLLAMKDELRLYRDARR